jgi:hypothetical protein
MRNPAKLRYLIFGEAPSGSIAEGNVARSRSVILVTLNGGAEPAGKTYSASAGLRTPRPPRFNTCV